MSCRYCCGTGLCDYRPDSGTWSAIAGSPGGEQLCRECEAAPQLVPTSTELCAVVLASRERPHEILCLAPTRDAAEFFQAYYEAEIGIDPREALALVRAWVRPIGIELEPNELHGALRKAGQ